LPLVPRTKEHACNCSGSFREDYCSENSEINSKTCWDNCRKICWFAAEVSGASPCPQPPAAAPTHAPARPHSFSLLRTHRRRIHPRREADAAPARLACDEARTAHRWGARGGCTTANYIPNRHKHKHGHHISQPSPFGAFISINNVFLVRT